VSVYPSVTSRCSIETAKRNGSRKQRRKVAHGTSFLMPKISAKFKGGHPQRERQTPVPWCRLINAGALVANWRLSAQSVVTLARSQVYHTERPPYLFAARSP